MNPSGIVVPPHLRAERKYLRAAEWWLSLDEAERQNVFELLVSKFPCARDVIQGYRKDWARRRLDVRGVGTFYTAIMNQVAA